MPPSSGRLTRRALIASAAAAAVPAGPEATRRPAPAAGLFTNPLDVKLADPCMIRDGGTYYLYATASMPEDANEGMPVWSSRDMVRWRCHGWAFRKRAEGWGTHWFWGPDVQRVAGGFLMHYGAFRKVDGKDVGRICVARSASAVGPFTDVKAPMFDWPGRGDAIDAFVFAEPDGAVYLYFTDAFQGRNTIWGARLSPDRLSLESEPKLLLQPDQPWEVDPVNEGAHVWKHGRGYCMMFSINDFRNPAYGMGFATADSPLGPWRKRAEGPVVRQAPGLRGPGCAGLIRSPDGKQTWAYMHVHLHPEGYARQLALARADLGPVAEGGRAFRVEPLSVAPQAAPSGAPPPARPRSDALGDRDIERRLWTIVDESPANWRKDGDAVVITAMDGDMWRARCDYRNLFLQPPWAADFRAAIHVAAEPTGNYEQAFLIAWQDADHYVRIGMLHADGPKFSAAIELDGVYEEVMVPNDLGGAVDLCLSRKGDIWTFEAASPSVRKRIGSPREARLSLPRVGFGAIAPGTKRPHEARFRSFRWADSSGN